MKYYFFRDIDNKKNLLNGKTYHASGYVEKLYCESDNGRISGKDLAVRFFEPFSGTITTAWRALGEVELFEVDELEYEQLAEYYNEIAELVLGEFLSHYR